MTEEFGAPDQINTHEPWIVEIPVGDWYYRPGFTYNSGMMIRYVIEAISRDGNAAICVSPLPDGSLDEGSKKMLEEVGDWMRMNGEAVYGSHAWDIAGEGEIVDGKLKMLPKGKLERKHAEFKFSDQDFRFTVGKTGSLYAFCMTVPSPESQLTIKSLSKTSGFRDNPVSLVRLIGFKNELEWEQTESGLIITCPKEMPFTSSIVFEIQ